MIHFQYIFMSPPVECPFKKKQGSETCGSKAKKAAGSEGLEEQTESESSEEEEEEEEDGATDSQPLSDTMLSASQSDELYTVHSIKRFLQKTKNMKIVQFDDYFAD